MRKWGANGITESIFHSSTNNIGWNTYHRYIADGNPTDNSKDKSGRNPTNWDKINYSFINFKRQKEEIKNISSSAE